MLNVPAGQGKVAPGASPGHTSPEQRGEESQQMEKRAQKLPPDGFSRMPQPVGVSEAHL